MCFIKRENLVDIGYNKLFNGNNLDYLLKLSNRLANKNINVKSNAFNIDKIHLEKCLIQFLIQRFLYIGFNKKILEALGRKNKKLKIGLPKQWLKHLEEEGFKADTFSNKIRWYGFVLFWFFGGIYKIFNYFFLGVKSKNFTSVPIPYLYFDNLSIKNIPNNLNYNTKTILDWYVQYGEDDYEEINHQVKSPKIKLKGKNIVQADLPVKSNLPFFGWLIYLVNAMCFALKSIFYFLKGDFTHAILLKEYPLLYLTQKSKKEYLARKYLFHNSTPIFRPLWTYEAEKKGAEIILYYYSTGNSVLKFDKGYHREYGNREFMSWSRFYVWNTYQESYVKSYFPNAEIKIVGPIWFESYHTKLELPNNKKVVSVFDIQPMNEKRFRLLGVPDRYITTLNLIQFQKDIISVFSQKDVQVILKRKRKEGKDNDLEYVSYVNDLYSSDKFRQIPPEFDAWTIINKSFLTISYPPTSTANISRFCNINTIYYDPTRTVDPEDEALFGVRLIRGIDELNDYVSNELDL